MTTDQEPDHKETVAVEIESEDEDMIIEEEPKISSPEYNLFSETETETETDMTDGETTEVVP